MKKICFIMLSCTFITIWAAPPEVAKYSGEPIRIGRHLMNVEIMDTERARMQGMMYRTEMGEHQGMLFVFPQTARYCMWMKNTKIPLSVAFLDEKGRIVNMADMQPETEDSHCARKPVRYALEVPQGWFRKFDIKEGIIIFDILTYRAKN